MMMRLSPSLIDSYEYWKSDERSGEEKQEARFQELLSSIKGERWEPNEPVLRGSAFHDLLEREIVGMADRLESTDQKGGVWVFDGEGVRHVRAQIPPGTLFEVWGDLLLPEIDVRLRLRADGLSGNEVHEFKTTSRIDVDRYLKGVQWRCYLLAFKAEVVAYHICKLGFDKKAKVWRVKEYLPLRQYAYDGMRADVSKRAAALKSFIESQGLAEYRTD